MSGFKASYILSGPELLYLFNVARISPSRPAQYFIDWYLRDGGGAGADTAPGNSNETVLDAGGVDLPSGRSYEPALDAAEGLVFKKLAVKSSGAVILEPVVDLLVRSALTSDTMWIVKRPDGGDADLILKSAGIYLLIMRYPRIPDAWRVTPYPGKAQLFEDFDGFAATEACRIDSEGKRVPLDITGGSWMEDSGK